MNSCNLPTCATSQIKRLFSDKFMQSKTIASCLIIGLSFASSLASRADDTNTPTPPKPVFSAPVGPGTNMPMRVQPMPPRVPPNSPMSALSEEQRASFQKNLADARPKLMELNSKLTDARQEINDAMFSLKADENLIHQKVMAEAEIEAQMALVRAKAFSGIEPPLTTDEVDKFKHLAAGPPVRPTPRPMPQLPGGTNAAGPGLAPKQ